MRKLRIQVVLPMYGGSLPIGRYCVMALNELKQIVRAFDASKLYSGYLGLQKLDIGPSYLPQLENVFLKFVSNAIWAQTQEFKPDLMLALAQAPVDRNLLHKFRQEKIRTVMWFVEDYRLFPYWQVYAPLYDAFAVIQKEPFLRKLDECGQPHSFYLPLAAQPSFHKPVDLTPQEKGEYGSKVSFLGAGYPNRRRAFRLLTDKGLKIWGTEWEGDAVLAPYIQKQGERINEEESVKIYNASDINLNLHSSVEKDKLIGKGDFVNPRAFELAAMGAFQLVDKRSLMPDLFADNELAFFSDIEDLRKKIDYFLAHPGERKKYAEKARQRALKDHTYAQRMKHLIEYMEKEFGPWKSDENDSVSMDIPRELADKISALAAKLGLFPTASFEEVAAKLRCQNGPLDELETTILFLDEWRKQYQ